MARTRLLPCWTKEVSGLYIVWSIVIYSASGGFTNMADGILAVPCTGEKGYLDARIEVMTRGGHSSMPPPHTVGEKAVIEYTLLTYLM